jgi:hypothetical protein
MNALLFITHDSLNPALEFAAGQHDAVITTQTAQSDVCADAVHAPAVAAAGVRLAHLHDIPNANI